MATRETDELAVEPQGCKLKSLVWDIDKDVPGVVMGHHGGDRVQLRAIRGGREWDATRVRRLTGAELSRIELRNPDLKVVQ
ncbi:hypothetical protein [Streptomyces gilvus]|uniref:hypothetical protein n=1 Tax=Streptomyces gilvus TaxID=2920937 RepID=UPI001F10F228|nr:hypothetical protein [Streptomyces sp. CME 23]MCH5676345.1 hypothetical protein [Streptomyces sp. CME 23]